MVGKIIELGNITYVFFKNDIIVGYKIKAKGLMIDIRDQSDCKTLILDKGKTDENQ
jgi:hypothetical protein